MSACALANSAGTPAASGTARPRRPGTRRSRPAAAARSGPGPPRPAPRRRRPGGTPSGRWRARGGRAGGATGGGVGGLPRRTTDGTWVGALRSLQGREGRAPGLTPVGLRTTRACRRPRSMPSYGCPPTRPTPRGASAPSGRLMRRAPAPARPVMRTAYGGRAAGPGDVRRLDPRAAFRALRVDCLAGERSARGERRQGGRGTAGRGRGAQDRRQGRLLVADHRGGRTGRRPRRRARGRPGQDQERRGAGGRSRLLGRHRRRPRAAGTAPPPRDLARQQAAASVGQGLLVARYTASFARYGVRVGQVLLTSDDMSRRAHHRNASRTLDKLLAMGASRSSTRTTRWPPTRSASATTTGSPPSSPIWSAPTCWCCCPTWTASTTATPPAPAPRGSRR